MPCNEPVNSADFTDMDATLAAAGPGPVPGSTRPGIIALVVNADEISAVYRGFVAGQRDAVQTVAGWIGAVVRAGNWRFDDAESVAQDIQLELFRMAEAKKVREPGGFQKLVYTVAKFTCVDAYHRQRRRGQHETPEEWPEERADPDANPAEGIESRERTAMLTYVIQRLPRACRELWDLVYREKLPAAAVAKKLGISVGNVRVRVHRCLRKARAIHEESLA